MATVARAASRLRVPGHTRLQQHDALLLLGQLGDHGGDELVSELAVERVPGDPVEVHSRRCPLACTSCSYAMPCTRAMTVCGRTHE